MEKSVSIQPTASEPNPQVLHVEGWPLRRAVVSEQPRLEALQKSAYAGNRALLGVEPIPLKWNYAEILRDYEVWVMDQTVSKPASFGARPDAATLMKSDGTRSAGEPVPSAGPFTAALIAIAEADSLLVESLAVLPSAQGQQYGRRLLGAAELRAQQLGLGALTLYTGQVLQHLHEWYQRAGFVVVGEEKLPDRTIVHFRKMLVSAGQ